MEYQIQYIATLAYIDEKLKDLYEEFGDLPIKLEKQKKRVSESATMLEETAKILDDIKKFVASTKVALVDMKEKEEKLSQQQFAVRNNKEFDAITHELSYLKTEHEKLADQLRTEGIKEENLRRILEEQQAEHETAKSELGTLEAEINELQSEQADEVRALVAKRDKVITNILKNNYDEYERIKEFHGEGAVRINRGSIRGYKIPSQVVVELRNNLDKIFIDENTGKIMIPEEIVIDDETVGTF